MARIKVFGRLTRPGLKVAKVLAGGKGRRPGAINYCVSKKLKGKSHPEAPEGQGGLRNKGWQKEFLKAMKECGANLTEGTIEKWDLK